MIVALWGGIIGLGACGEAMDVPSPQYDYNRACKHIQVQAYRAGVHCMRFNHRSYCEGLERTILRPWKP